MMKDTFFSMSRFMKLCRKDVMENWKANLLRFVLMYGVLAIVIVYDRDNEYAHVTLENGMNWLYPDPAWHFIYNVFAWFLLCFGCLSASLTLEKMKSKAGRLSVLMLPATSFEKFFSRWLITTVAFLIVFFIAFELADFTRVAVYSFLYPEAREVIIPIRIWDYDPLADAYFRMMLIPFYFFVQSFFVLGSTVWPRNAFLKTFAAVTIIWILYISAYVVVMKLMTAYGYNSSYILRPFESKEIMAPILSICFSFFAVVNWTLAYFRFKESEIIHRM